MGKKTKLTMFGTPAVPPTARLPWEPHEDGGPCPSYEFEGGHARLYPEYSGHGEKKCDNGCDSEGMLYGGTCAKCRGHGVIGSTYKVGRCRVNVWIHGEVLWQADFEAFGPLEEMEKFVEEVQALREKFPAKALPEMRSDDE